MRRMIPSLLLAVAAVAGLSACDRRVDRGPVVVSAIGAAPELRDAARTPVSTSDAILAGATAQGLVRFDANGEIEPGVAARWIVIDDGMSYIFRLRRLRWPDGRPVTAREVVATLKRQIAKGSRNPLAPYLTAIDDVVEMTPDVIEIDLARPRPDLLKLFAQPELAIVRARPTIGTGPFRIRPGHSGQLLVPVPDPDLATDQQEGDTPERDVRLIGERAAMAILRFARKRSDAVLGGTVAEWPLLARADVPDQSIRIDPAAGLFGLAVVDRSGFLAEPANRVAIAQAIDRSALTAAFSRDWAPTEQLLPEQLDSSSAPAIAPWVATAVEDRRAAARTTVAEWRVTSPGPITLRLALPAGPGGTRLWRLIGSDLGAIGIRTIRVAIDAPADLRLIDAVAPYDSARWYLATACITCGETAAGDIENARIANTLVGRADAIAAADAAFAADGGYIPIARPLRWSLVASRLKAWKPNARAWHPLNHLRDDPR